MPEDFYTIDMMDAYQELGLLNGETASEDLVNKIFKLSEEGAISEVNKIEKEIDCMITDIYFKR